MEELTEILLCRAHLTALPSGPLGSNPSSSPPVLHWVGDICFCLLTCSPAVGATSGVEVRHRLQDCSLTDYGSPSLQPVPVCDKCQGGCCLVGKSGSHLLYPFSVGRLLPTNLSKVREWVHLKLLWFPSFYQGVLTAPAYFTL